MILINNNILFNLIKKVKKIKYKHQKQYQNVNYKFNVM
jgi:hypothetical protein